MSKKNKKDAAPKKVKEKAPKVDKKEAVFGSPVRNLIITAVVCAVLGVAFLVRPSLVYEYCGYAIGGVIGVVGLAYILIYFLRKPVSGVYRYEFGIGIVALVAGLYVAFGGYLNTETTTVGIAFTVIVKIIGILIAADGVLKLQYAVDIARMRFPRWWVVLIFSVLGIALGVAIVLGYVYDIGGTIGLGKNSYLTEAQNAFIGGLMMLGVAFCVNAVLDLGAMIVILIRNHRANRDAAIAEGAAMVSAAKQEEIDGGLQEEILPAASQEPAPVIEPVIVPSAEPAPVVEPAPAPVIEPVPAPVETAIEPVAEPAPAVPLEGPTGGAE